MPSQLEKEVSEIINYFKNNYPEFLGYLLKKIENNYKRIEEICRGSDEAEKIVPWFLLLLEGYQKI